MRNIGLSKLQNLLFVLLMFALSGCGASSSNIASSDPAANAKITAKLVWSADGKNTAKTVAAVPTGVLTVRFKVTGPYQIPGDTSRASRYTTTKASFPAADGGGTVAVAPGNNLIVNAEALGAGDVLLYEAIVKDVTVVAGETKDLGTITLVAPMYKAADVPCLGCHENSRSVSGDSLVAEYKDTAHYRRTVSPSPKYGVNSTGCAGCHGPNHDNLDPAEGFLTSRCYECHNAAGNFPTIHAERNYQDRFGFCTDCHQSHSLSFKQNLDLALNHGSKDPASPFAAESDNTSCTRCHTGQGFSAYIASPQGTQTAQVAGSSNPLRCSDCHTSDYSLKSVGAVTAPYTDAPTTYPDAGESNLCLNCHTGRVSGDSIRNSTSDFSNTGFKNSHYLSAGGTVFSKTGFHFYSSSSNTASRNFDSNLKNDGNTNDYLHDNLGISTTGDAEADTFITGNKLTVAGPCVVCHLGSRNLGKATTHKFSPFTVYASGDVSLNPVCVTCHSTRGAGTDAKATWFEGSWKVRINAALDAQMALLESKGIFFSSNYPYFFKDADGSGSLEATEAVSANGYKTWETPYGAGTGKNTMGAAFNYNLLLHDPGAVAHNRYYSRRLIYDSIDYLDDGVMNYSVFATLNALADTVSYKANAITFLINRGTADANVGTKLERY